MPGIASTAVRFRMWMRLRAGVVRDLSLLSPSALTDGKPLVAQDHGNHGIAMTVTTAQTGGNGRMALATSTLAFVVTTCHSDRQIAGHTQ